MKLLLVSSSRLRSNPPLSHVKEAVVEHLAGIKVLTFIPYARPGGATYEAYTANVAGWFKDLIPDLKVKGIHEWDNPIQALDESEAVFTGGGNTFKLQTALYDNQYKPMVISKLRERVKAGMPYMGSSAGSNIAGETIGTTNDMPVVYPPSFIAMGVIPFNINPHYPAPPSGERIHRGETRDERLNEFIIFNDLNVLAIREDHALVYRNGEAELIGHTDAKIFFLDGTVKDIPPGKEVNLLWDLRS